MEHGCIVVGEDLGTIPENFRETLADWGIWTYQVMLFERSGDGAFFPPESYRENALVSFGTHDLATFAGWRDQHDLAVKQALGMDPGETSANCYADCGPSPWTWTTDEMTLLADVNQARTGGTKCPGHPLTTAPGTS